MQNQGSRAGYVLGPGEGESTWFLGTLMTVKAGEEETGGAFTLLEWSAPPGLAPPPHIHHREDEAFFIFEGEMEVRCGERTWRAGPGSFVFLPRGIEHGFTVTSAVPLHGLQLTLPSGFEQFIAESGEPAHALTQPPPSAPDVPRLLAAAEKLGVEMKLAPPDAP
jgi:mannose-6-phosphate isomerase-like protein (cupin superfamily)